MCCTKFAPVGMAIAALVAVAGSIAFAQPGDKKTDKKQPEHQPAQGQPAMTPEQQACMEAGTPGEMHAKFAKEAGHWTAKTKSWEGPDAKPTDCEMTTNVTTIMGGRFLQCDVSGEMPGMGKFEGRGVYGFDNTSQKLQATWIDNVGTGQMIGTGEASTDGSTITWTYNYTCPVTKKATTMREVDRHVDENTKTITMFAIDPKTGKEYKMMEQTLKRTKK